MSKHISRRKFIKTIGAGVVASLSLPSFRSLAKANSEQIDLAVVQGNPIHAVAKALDLIGGIKKFIHPNDMILIKPNISFPNPKNWGSTTNPEVVKAVAQLVIEAGASRAIVADNTMREGMICFERTGLIDELKVLDQVKVIPLQQESYFAEVEVPNGNAIKSVKIAKLIQRCNVLINLPCAKSHAATDVSFGLKNLMGLIWDREYFHQGTDLHTAIAELSTVVRPQLTILDATRALVTGGPTGPGKIQELNTIIASTDPLAVDAYAASLTNWNNRSTNAQSIKHLSHAAKIGVGEIDLDKIKIKKESV
ncbi:MAG: DUF362 domain-containing protein [bacterium]|nr:MAG: DUF362 domain-containing protein [bacterium]